MRPEILIDRRTAIAGIAKTAAAVAFLGTACTSETQPATTPRAIASTTVATTGAISTLAPPPGPGTEWARVQFGVATTYLLHSDGKGVLVDTGTRGAATAIEEVLDSIGIGWSDIQDIILTHRHGANIGALHEVSALANQAIIHAGREDIPEIDPPPGRQIQPVVDGDRVFGLTIVETPGHTPGHISVLDQAAGVLVDGDLIVIRGEEIFPPNSETSDDIGQAFRSLEKLAMFDYEVILTARGDPILADGSEVMSLIAQMPRS